MQKRPVFLNIFVLRFPITAIVSILHRLSGLWLFLGIPLLLWFLERSLKAPVYFRSLQHTVSGIWWQLIIWSLIAALIYHILAGLRHLLMDMGMGESKVAGRFSAYFVLVAFVALLGICIGVCYLW